MFLPGLIVAGSTASSVAMTVVRVALALVMGTFQVISGNLNIFKYFIFAISELPYFAIFFDKKPVSVHWNGVGAMV